MVFIAKRACISKKHAPVAVAKSPKNESVNSIAQFESALLTEAIVFVPNASNIPAKNTNRDFLPYTKKMPVIGTGAMPQTIQKSLLIRGFGLGTTYKTKNGPAQTVVDEFHFSVTNVKIAIRFGFRSN
ncbi:MAG TPA: hypothetical protein VJY41_04335 [Prolixibacteraceae bacterium]|nr:hypothetical protein [Prolixibacteraceae bacterium]